MCIFYKIPTEININYKKLHLLGSGEWGIREQGDKGTRGQGDKGTRGENLKQVFPLVPNSPCLQLLLPNAQIKVVYSVFGAKRRVRVLGHQNGFFRCREFGSLRDLYRQATLHHRVVLVK